MKRKPLGMRFIEIKSEPQRNPLVNKHISVSSFYFSILLIMVDGSFHSY